MAENTIRRMVKEAVAGAKVTDLHTHLYSPEFGPLMLWDIDETLTYHYLIAEVFRRLDMPYDHFWALSKPQQADLIWQKLFLEHSPVSEACRGVLTVLKGLGLDASVRDLNAHREFFRAQESDLDRYVETLFDAAGVEAAVMTNDPFDDTERPLWLSGSLRVNRRFKAALRVDVMLNQWSTAWPKLVEWGYHVQPGLGGDTEATVRIRHTYNKSTFVQDVTVYDGVPRIDFRLSADWYEQGTPQESGPMLKVAFPISVIDVNDVKATFEIPFGSIERPAKGNEVPGQKWIDVSQGGYGVSLLNDCKYGHDVNGSTMRLTLLRCSDNPDPTPDQGHHEITYSLYPHQGDWRQANSVRRGYELNNPLLPLVVESHRGRLPARHSFVEVSPSNVIVTALKKAEESDDLILRLYECEGRGGTASISLGMPAKSVRETNLMEQPTKGLDTPVRTGRISVPIGKWEIKTLRISQ